MQLAYDGLAVDVEFDPTIDYTEALLVPAVDESNDSGENDDEGDK